MNRRSLTPEHIEALFLQVRAMHRYLGLLKRRLIDLKLMAQEPDLFEYLTEAAEAVEYLNCFLHDRCLRHSCGGWDLPFAKMTRPVRKLKRVK